jgi:serine/threonine-protein kinase
MKTRIFALALAAAAAIPAAAQAMTYSAIALSPHTGAYGYAYDQPSQGAANGVALSNCRNRPGYPRDCRVVQWTRGRYCAVLVLNHDTSNGSVGWGSGSAPNEGDARRIAWRECRANNGGCDQVAATVCSH